ALSCRGHRPRKAAMTDEPADQGLRDRITRQSEDALGKLASELIESPLVNGALSRAFEARDLAAQAQELAMGALNIPSAADIERLTRRVRSVSQRLEGIEDGVDRVDGQVRALSRSEPLAERLERIEESIAGLAGEVETLRKALPGRADPMPSA
ncbi:MAG: hypothetical protein ACR2NH_11315, partial [Solirubrobacteraceae bacterium]